MGADRGLLMPYARFDDRYDDHKKIRRAWRREPAAVGLHTMAITYCNRHVTDGIIDADWVEERLAMLPHRPQDRQRVLDTLLELGLFERLDEDRFLVHDFLEWNLSREQRDNLRAQGRRGGLSKGPSPADSNGSSPGLTQGLTEGLSDGGAGGSSDGSSDGSSTPSPSPTPTPKPTPTNTPVEPDRLDQARAQRQAQEHEIFTTWVQATSRTASTAFDDKRRRVVRRALTQLPFDDVLDAARGVRHSEHHMSNRQWSELKVILRDVSQIEHFRDLERTHGHRRPLPESLAEHPCGEDETAAQEWEQTIAALPNSSAQAFLQGSHPHQVNDDDDRLLIGVKPDCIGWLLTRSSNPNWLEALFGGRRVEFIECPSIERSAA